MGVEYSSSQPLICGLDKTADFPQEKQHFPIDNKAENPRRRKCWMIWSWKLTIFLLPLHNAYAIYVKIQFLYCFFNTQNIEGNLFIFLLAPE